MRVARNTRRREGGPESGTASVVRACPNLTARQLDYWLRTGRLGDVRTAGQGYDRTFTAAEVAAICDMACELRRLRDQTDVLMSGAYYRDRLAHHEIGGPS